MCGLKGTGFRCRWLLAGLLIALAPVAGAATNVDTGQTACYGDHGEIACPRPGQPFYGQDAQFVSQTPRYRDNGDGTVTDLNTGLMWSKGLSGHKVTPAEGAALAAKLKLAGHRDWRVPSIKELYSLIDYRGYTGFHGRDGFWKTPANAVPFIDTDYFNFAYGDTAHGERYIDAQWLSSTQYVSTTMNGMDTVFGVNFADGRIKGYGYRRHGTRRVVKTFYIRYVRGPVYGVNDFVDNGDGTVTDRSTGLMWSQKDSGRGMDWQDALHYCGKLQLAGHDDWRLPNAKELEYIVDYSRSPDTTDSPAIAPIFRTSAITNEAGQKDYPYFWTSTTHLDGPRPGSDAVYIAFGRAIGEMNGRIMDVHGAGAQRSDPKVGEARLGHGPQGDAQRIMNYVRCVRGGAEAGRNVAQTDPDRYPNKVRLAKIKSDPGLILGHEALKHRREGEGPPRGRRGFVARLDRNGDGRVSRAEFDGPPDQFDVLDRNHDGYLTEDEAPRGPSPGRGRPPGPDGRGIQPR